MEHQTPPQELEMLVFELAGVRYALELPSVREVVRAVMISPLPDAPAVIEGVVDMRGALVPVYDLRARFGHPPRPLHPDERLGVAWTGSRRVSFRWERTRCVAHVPRARVEPRASAPGGG